ncbi:MAG: hypothetical protein Kow0099_19520 [Candidatus Abyssubacteria bacterium]
MGSLKKKPNCWEIRECSQLLYLSCPAYQSDAPCWEHPDTQCCKLMGTPKTCAVCEVFLKWQSTVNSSRILSKDE